MVEVYSLVYRKPWLKKKKKKNPTWHSTDLCGCTYSGGEERGRLWLTSDVCHDDTKIMCFPKSVCAVGGKVNIHVH